MAEFVLAIDQGTTGSTALIVDSQGAVVSRGYREFPQIFPKPGWVEHDPEEIWSSCLHAIGEAVVKAGIQASSISAIGITNQRETSVLWDRQTGRPVHNAIVWQCRRTSDLCRTLKQAGHESMVKEKTGLVLDPYFSGTKVAWMLDHVPQARTMATEGRLAFGTIDCFLISRLTRGKAHVTDPSNASRTLLFNLHTLDWDDDLLSLLSVPRTILPLVVENAGEVGRTLGVPGLPDGMPITGMAGDQQSALFGQNCFQAGSGKVTFGTGAFLLVNTGHEPRTSQYGLLSTVAWKVGGVATYALEGSAFIAGAAVQWLRDQLQILERAPQIEEMALSVPDSGGLVFVPALTGLGAPYWRSDARGAIMGITRGTGRGHVARATLEGIALQNHDIIRAMADDLGCPLREIRVDGGASANNLLMQIQADLLGCRILRPRNVETTALGAAYLAGHGVGMWPDLESLREVWQLDREFSPKACSSEVEAMIHRWNAAIARL